MIESSMAVEKERGEPEELKTGEASFFGPHPVIPDPKSNPKTMPSTKKLPGTGFRNAQ